MTGATVDVAAMVVGAGPVGLLTAVDLAQAGVDVVVVERRRSRTAWSRALNLYPRTLEILDQRGLADRLLSQGRRVTHAHFAALPELLDLTVLDTPFPFMLALPQNRVEQVLEDHARGLGAVVRRGWGATAVRQDPGGVDVDLDTPAGPERVRAGYLVGCDGSHSLIRAQTGIAFPGSPAHATSLLADLVLDRPPGPDTTTRNDPRGVLLLRPVDDHFTRVIVIDRHTTTLAAHEPATLSEVRAALLRVCGDDFGARDPLRVTRVSGISHHAERYLAGRVLLAGDAAHSLFPAGGQGLNVGLQDAAALGGKLAAQCTTRPPGDLLTTYAAQRREAVRQMLAGTDAQRAVMTDFTAAGDTLKARLNDLLTIPRVNTALAELVAGLPFREGHGLPRP